jgi:hypothetical protein
LAGDKRFRFNGIDGLALFTNMVFDSRFFKTISFVLEEFARSLIQRELIRNKTFSLSRKVFFDFLVPAQAELL